jgi:hypothetical protein
MTTYPSEGVVFLYALLFLTQTYWAWLAARGRLPVQGRISLTLRYASLALAFLWLALGTAQPPLLDLVHYRRLLRSSYIAYCLLCLYAILRYWVLLIRQQRASRD